MRLAASTPVDHHGHSGDFLLGVHFELSAHADLLRAEVLPVLEHFHVRILACRLDAGGSSIRAKFSLPLEKPIWNLATANQGVVVGIEVIRTPSAMMHLI